VFASVVGYLVHLFFGLSVTGTTVILWLLLGLLVAPRAKTLDVKAAMPAVGWLASAVVLVAAIAVSVGNVRYVTADHQYLLSRIDVLAADQDLAAAKKAVKLNPYNDMYRAEVGLAYMDYASQVLASAQQGDTATIQQAYNLMQQAERSFKDTIKFVPAEYDNYVFLANLYIQMGNYFDPAYYEQAKAIALQGIGVEKYGPAVRVEYARALHATQEDPEAIKQLKYSLGLDPAYGAAAYLLSTIYEDQGDLAGALEVLKDVDARLPNQTGVAERIAALEASLTAK